MSIAFACWMLPRVPDARPAATAGRPGSSSSPGSSRTWSRSPASPASPASSSHAQQQALLQKQALLLDRQQAQMEADLEEKQRALVRLEREQQAKWKELGAGPKARRGAPRRAIGAPIGSPIAAIVAPATTTARAIEEPSASRGRIDAARAQKEMQQQELLETARRLMAREPVRAMAARPAAEQQQQQQALGGKGGMERSRSQRSISRPGSRSATTRAPSRTKTHAAAAARQHGEPRRARQQVRSKTPTAAGTDASRTAARRAAEFTAAQQRKTVPARSGRSQADVETPEERSRRPYRINVSGARSAVEAIQIACADNNRLIEEMNATNPNHSVQLCKWRVVHAPRDVTSDVFFFSTSKQPELIDMVGLFTQRNGIGAGRKINKWWGINNYVAKVALDRILTRMSVLFPKEFDFFPKTWALPYQLAAFKEEVRANGADSQRGGKGQTYIVKPDTGSQGDGIYLVRQLHDLRLGRANEASTAVAQQYLDRPYLIDGLKFDLRIYVLLYSVTPPVAYVCREGLARFCTEPYAAPTSANVRDVFMHLTNYSLNARSEKFVRGGDALDEGNKRTMSSVFRHLLDIGVDTDALWQSLMDIITKTLAALAVPLANEYAGMFGLDSGQNPRSFQLLGFDVMLDENLKPWLLEINSNPSLSVQGGDGDDGEGEQSAIDVEVKRKAVGDGLRIVWEHWRGNGDDFDSGSYSQCHFDRFSHMLVLHQVRECFEAFAGVRSLTAMGSSKFVSFCRRMNFAAHPSIRPAEFDIVFVDTLRNDVPTTAGASTVTMDCMSFCDALLRIAQRRYANLPPLEALVRLLQHMDKRVSALQRKS